MKISRIAIIIVLISLMFGTSSASGDEDFSPKLFSGKDGIHTWEFVKGYSGYFNSYINYFGSVLFLYYLDNDNTWPESWDDLREDYMPYLPVSIWSGEDMKLEMGNEIPKRVRKGTIFALVEEDGGWLILVPKMSMRRKFEWSDPEMSRKTRDGNIEMTGDKPEIYSNPLGRFSMVNGNFVRFQMRAFFDANGRVPENANEFLVGYKINMDYDYQWNPFEQIGMFKLTVYPGEDAYAYNFKGYSGGHKYGGGFGNKFSENSHFPQPFPGGGIIKTTKDGEEVLIEYEPVDTDELESDVIFSHYYFTEWLRKPPEIRKTCKLSE